MSMRIRCLTVFKDGTRTYQKDDIVSVKEEDGYRFVGHGWAVDVSIEDHPGAASGGLSADLNVHSSTLGVSNKGF
jgi:hypothetical protein